MKKNIEAFTNFLTNEKQASKNTLESCKNDLKKMKVFLESKNIKSLTDVTPEIINNYFAYLEENYSKATVSRNLSTLRMFYKFAEKNKIIKENPTINIKSIKVPESIPNTLNTTDINNLLQQPDLKTPAGLRDRAMLELICVTGMKITEFLSLNTDDIDFKNNLIKCSKNRVIPLNSSSIDILKAYDKKFHSIRMNNTEDKALFVNLGGTRISRQAFWKNIKKYKNQAKIENNVTSQIIRNSVAMYLLENGSDNKTSTEFLGYSDSQIMQKFNKVIAQRTNKFLEVNWNNSNPLL